MTRFLPHGSAMSAMDCPPHHLEARWRHFAPWRGVVLWLAVFMLVGCGTSGPRMAKVTGSVTWQGRTVTEGKIGFYPDQGVPAFGQIQSDGTYTLRTFQDGDGAMVGHHHVTIESMRIVASQPPPQTFQEEIERASTPQRRPPPLPKVEWLVPQKYAREDTSGLTADVQDQANVIDFRLDP